MSNVDISEPKNVHKNFISGKFWRRRRLHRAISALRRRPIWFFPPTSHSSSGTIFRFQKKEKQKKKKIFPRNHSSLGHASRLISIYANELKGAPATDQSEATADETLSNQKTRDAPKLRTTLSLDAQYPMQSGDDANANFMQISTWFPTGRAPDVPESRPLTAHTVTKLRPSVAPWKMREKRQMFRVSRSSQSDAAAFRPREISIEFQFNSNQIRTRRLNDLN